MKRRGEGNGINNRCVTVERCTRSQRHLVNILQTRGDNWAQWPDKGILLFQSVDQSEENFSLMYWYFVVVQLVFCSCVLKNLVLQVHSHLVWCTYKNEICLKTYICRFTLYQFAWCKNIRVFEDRQFSHSSCVVHPSLHFLHLSNKIGFDILISGHENL